MPSEPSVSVVRPQPGLADYVELAKPRITALVMFTSLVGFVAASPESLTGAALLGALLGTGLVAAGASVFNMLLERDTDALMQRTRRRPLPAGRLRPVDALAFGAALTLSGLALLLWLCGPLAGAVALVTWLSYVFLYTPLKPITSLATMVGAVPGALPPVIGWAAARGSLDVGAGLLFAILFLWQIPHFLAIAWMYREDYARGGFPMLPVLDQQGSMTARQAFANAVALLLVSLMPTPAGLAGPWYFAGALLLGLAFVAMAYRLLRRRSMAAARQLFLASVVYLPLLTSLLMLDRR